MSKLLTGKGYDDEGYMELIPRGTQSEALRCSSIHEGEDSSDYWRARCMQLEKENEELKKEVLDVLDILDEQGKIMDSMQEYFDNELALRTMEIEESLTKRGTALASIHEPMESSDSDFDWGVGLKFGGGKDPEFYRISDPKRPLIQKKKFAGGTVEVQPGRGFSIGLRWKAVK